MSTLTGNVVIVTGASSGIGEATALMLGQRGARVVCAARRSERLADLVSRIVDAGGKAIARTCDVTSRDDVFAVAQAARDTFGPIDAIVNNAGVMPISYMDRCDTDGWDLMVDVNIKGVLYGIAAVLPEMIERQSGHIINVSSIAGRRVMPGASVYCATKHAVHALSEGLRQEVAAHGVRVTLISPGWVETELQEAVSDERIRDRWTKAREANTVAPLTSADIAESIVFALSSPPNVAYNELLIRPTRQEP